MSLTLKNNGGGGDFQTVEPGNYPGRCVMVIDCGTQKIEYLGEVKQVQQVYIRFELGEYMEDGRPFIIGNTYTASLHEKAKLRKDLEGFRGKKFTDDELKGFQLEKILGQCCMVNVTDTEKNGKKYQNITALTKMPKGMAAPEQHNSLVYFDIDYPDMEVLEKLPKFLHEKVTNSAEWKLRGKQPDVAPATAKTEAPVTGDEDQDIPF